MEAYFQHIYHTVGIEGNTMNLLQTRKFVYQGTAHGADNTAYLFADHEILSRINRVDTIYLDTFNELVSLKPNGLSHLLTMLIRRGQTTIPVLLSMCSDRSEELYMSIFNFVLERVPLLSSIQTVVTSLERPLVRAIRRFFPNCFIRCTWLHIIRNHTRLWAEKKLPMRYNDTVLKLSWAYPLVPEHLRPQALLLIKEESSLIENEHMDVAVYLRHVERFNDFHRQARSVRFTNVSEDFAGGLSHSDTERPSIFELLKRIRNVLRTGVAEILRNRSTVTLTDENTNTRIASLQHMLNNSRITLETFLSCVIDRHQSNLISLAVANETNSKIATPYFDDLQDPVGGRSNRATTLFNLNPQVTVDTTERPTHGDQLSWISSSQLRLSPSPMDFRDLPVGTRDTALDDTMMLTSESDDEDLLQLPSELSSSLTRRRTSSPSLRRFPAVETSNTSPRTVQTSSVSPTHGHGVFSVSLAAHGTSSPSSTPETSSISPANGISSVSPAAHETSSPSPTPGTSSISPENGVSNVSSVGPGTSSVSPANGVSNVSSAGPGTSSVSPANGVSNVSSAGSGTSSVAPANGVSNVSSAGPGTSSVSPANGVSSASPAVAGTSNVSPVQPLTAAIIISDSDNDEDPVNHKFICVCCRKNPPVLAFVHCGHRCVCVDCRQKVGNKCPLCRRCSGAIRIYDP